MEQKSTAYHRAAAARARRLRAEATTRWLKEHLEREIDWHDQELEQIKRASEIGVNVASPQDRGDADQSETPGR